MFKIDTTDASTTEPSRGVAGALKFFSTALKTIVPDWWLNMLQNEVATVVTTSGLSLDKADDTQLAAAIALIVNAGQPYLHIRDEKADGTEGGTFTSGSYLTRELTDVKTNTITGASLATNQVTLPAGTYDIRAMAPAHRADRHKVRLRNITDGSDIIIGNNAESDTSDSVTMAHLTGRFTIAAEKIIELQHQCTTTKTIDGFGYACSFGDIEVYASIEFWKLV